MITNNLFYLDAGGNANLSDGIDSGFDITVQNVGSTPIYLGGSNESNNGDYGYRLDAGTSFSIELSGQDDLWAFSNDNGGAIAVLRAHLENGK